MAAIPLSEQYLCGCDVTGLVSESLCNAESFLLFMYFAFCVTSAHLNKEFTVFVWAYFPICKGTDSAGIGFP